MSRLITNIEANTDTFQIWLDRTNAALDALEETVTVKANTTGDITVGNGFVSGIFGANTLTATTLRGGNVTTSDVLTISSNAVLSGAQINSTANLYVTAANVQYNSNSSIVAFKISGNSTATNTFIGGTDLRITSNTRIDGTLRTTANTIIDGELTANSNVIIKNGLSANDSYGTDGYGLYSNGSSIYWDTSVKSVTGGTGLDGGTITTSGSLSINTAYIATLTANNTYYFGGQLPSYYRNATNINAGTLAIARLDSTVWHAGNDGAGSGLDADLLDGQQGSYYTNATNIDTGTLAVARLDSSVWHSGNDGAGSGLDADLLDGQHGSYYTNATNLLSGTIPYPRIPSNIINTTANFTRSGITTFAANVVLGSSGLSANGSYGTDSHGLYSNGTATYWATSVKSVTGGAGINGGTITSSGTFSVNTAYIATLTANNAAYLNDQPASYYTNATNLLSGTIPYARIPVNVVNTTANFTRSGITTFAANVVLGSSGLSANGSYGNNGSTLVSNGTATFWSDVIYANNSIGSNAHLLHSDGAGGMYWSLIEDISYATSNNALYLDGQPASYYRNATNINAGTLAVARLDSSVWHSGNDGTGSGLDADLLDGRHIGTSGNAVPLLDGTNTWSGRQTINQWLSFENGRHNFTYNDGGGNFNIRLGNEFSTGAPRYTADTEAAVHWVWNQDFSSTNPGVSFNMAPSPDTVGKVAGDVITFTPTLYFDYNGTITYKGNAVWHAGNDGAGSGLNADLLDGQQGSYYTNASNINAGTLNDARLPATISSDITGTANNSTYLGGQLPSYYTNASNINAGTLAVARLDSSVWHSGNDGAGSGLDADLLDGQQGSYYLDATNITNDGAGSGLDADLLDGQQGSYYLDATNITNDGAGSGLDADLLDGQQGSYYQTNLNNISNFELSSGLSGDRTTYIDLHSDDTNTDYSARLIRNAGVNGVLSLVQVGTGNININGGTNLTRDGQTIWHGGNDGAGSGLDADLLDGQQGSYYTNASNLNAGTLPVARLDSSVNPLGQQTIWVPASGMTAGLSGFFYGADTVTITQGYATTLALAFDPARYEIASFVIQMPKSWNEGTVIVQPVWTHPATTTNFGVVWGVGAAAYSDGDAPANYTGANYVSIQDTGGTTNDIYIAPESSAMTIEGSPSPEDFVTFSIFRFYDDANDTMAVDAYLLGLKIHYTIDQAKDN